MMRRPPGFWQGARTPFERLCCQALWPLSRAYDFLFRQRFDMHHPVPLDRPVICVGNLVLGGAGKTPVTLALAEALKTEGYNPHIVTRGYGGAEEGPLQVSPNRDTARDVGDEALLLVEAAPTWVSRRRALGGQAAIESGASIILMDDGFQNPSFYKDFSIIVIDGESGLGNGHMLPAGPLREDLAHALARAQAVVLIGEDRRELRAEIARLSAVPVFTARLNPAAAAPHLAGQEVYAFAGIGRPEKFRATLEAAGAKVEGWAEFPDHYPYEAEDLRELMSSAAEKGLPVYTTSKDHVRVPALFKEQAQVFAVTLSLDDVTGLMALIRETLPQRR